MPDHSKEIVRGMLHHHKEMMKHIRLSRSSDDPKAKKEHKKQAAYHSAMAEPYERQFGLGEQMDINEIKINDRMREKAATRADDRNTKAWRNRGLRWIARKAILDPNADKKFNDEYSDVARQDDISRTLQRNSGKRNINEIKINDKMRDQSAKRLKSREDLAYFYNDLKDMGRRIRLDPKAKDKFEAGLRSAENKYARLKTVNRSQEKRKEKHDLEKYPPLHESGDRVFHEKYGAGSVIATRQGYVTVGFDKGFEHQFLEESAGKILRKISGRGEGLSPKSNSAKRGLANKLDQSADDKYHRAYDLRYPRGLMKIPAAMVDTIDGSARDKRADRLSAHAGKQKEKAAEMRDTANRRSKRIRYTYDSNARNKDQHYVAKKEADEFEREHRKVVSQGDSRSRTVPGYHPLHRGSQKHRDATHWKKHPPEHPHAGSANYEKYVRVTPTNKGYHIHYRGN